MDNLTNAYSNMQKEEDKKVFYGEKDIIERPGFDSIEAFDKGIKEVKNEISDYDELLLENQKRLKEILKEEDFYKVHPEVALPGEISKLHDMYLSLMDKKKMLLEKLDKGKKSLIELEEAKKEFIREKRKTHKNDVNDRMSLLDEHSRKQQEMKELEHKITGGVANQFDKERYNVLKNEVIPEIENSLKDGNLEETIYKDVQHDNSLVSETNKDNNAHNLADVKEVQNKIDSNDTVSEYDYGLSEKNNEQERIVVRGGVKPANLFEVVAPNENFKVKSQERKLVGAYPLTVEDLEKNSGLEKEKKKTVMKIITAPKKIIDSIKRIWQKHLEKKNQKDFEKNNVETQENIDNNVILASPYGELKTYSNNNELINNNLNNEEVNNENVVNEVQENNGEGIILASPDGSVVKQYDDNAEVTKVFAR